MELILMESICPTVRNVCSDREGFQMEKWPKKLYSAFIWSLVGDKVTWVQYCTSTVHLIMLIHETY